MAEGGWRSRTMENFLNPLPHLLDKRVVRFLWLTRYDV